jgi:competence protein ComEC
MSPTASRYLVCLAVSACILACFAAGCSIPDDLPFRLPGQNSHPAIVSALPGADLLVHVIDFGQGDAVLVQFRDTAMLIDAGEIGKGKTVVAYLEANDIERLDVVVATHAHSDHIGGMKEVLSAFPVGRFVDSGQPHTTRTYENLLIQVEDLGIPYTVAERGRTIDLDPDLTVQILNPAREPFGDLNEDSVVLKITYGGVSFLLTGDAGFPAEEDMRAAGLDLDADVIKVGHHGTRYASSAEFLAAVSPAVSIISVGEGNDYGHPHDEAMARLQAAGSQIYRTDESGTIVVATDGEQLAIATGATSVTVPTRTATPSPTPTAVPNATVPALAITDLDLTNETVTIQSSEPEPVNLTGWTITDEGTRNTYVFPLFVLDTGEDVTVHTGPGNDTATDLYWGRTSPVWNNDGDLATLADANGTVVATMER